MVVPRALPGVRLPFREIGAYDGTDSIRHESTNIAEIISTIHTPEASFVAVST